MFEKKLEHAQRVLRENPQHSLAHDTCCKPKPEHHCIKIGFQNLILIDQCPFSAATFIFFRYSVLNVFGKKIYADEQNKDTTSDYESGEEERRRGKARAKGKKAEQRSQELQELLGQQEAVGRPGKITLLRRPQSDPPLSPSLSLLSQASFTQT